MVSIPRLTPETTFAERYRVIERLGQGAMASVYRAEQLSTGTERALKVMDPQSLSDPKALERFEREARASGRIDSDHVVRVVGAGSDPKTGLLWIAQEYLPGELLSDFLDERPYPDTRELREIIEQLFHAVAAAHRADIVHRDLKPENIFLAQARRQGITHDVKVLDFGIAKMLRMDAAATAAGLGTPMWTAPEQGAPGHAIEPSADVWALGLIIFRLITGQIYWRHMQASSSAVDIAQEIIEGKIDKASQRADELGSLVVVPPAFDAWFARCVCRNPKKRFADAGEAYEELARAMGKMPMFDRRSMRRNRPVNPVVVALAVLLILVGLALTAYVLMG
ncbi:MAG: serine/threonine protein kinase [Deltaproteobacteria bacterium]|nr:serine/threonine protein kinase [Deltaproteobacteria bacterium]